MQELKLAPPALLSDDRHLSISHLLTAVGFASTGVSILHCFVDKGVRTLQNPKRRASATEISNLKTQSQKGVRHFKKKIHSNSSSCMCSILVTIILTRFPVQRNDWERSLVQISLMEGELVFLFYLKYREMS